MLICRPPGRGNWAPVVLTVEGKRASPLLIRAGQRFTLGGLVLRIARVVP